MALWYRLVAFGEPRGPWRARKSQVRRDAVSQALGEFDECGQFYLDGCAKVEWIHEDDLRQRAA